MRFEEVEKDHKAFKKQQEKKIKDLENACKQKTKKGNESEPRISKHVDIKCGKCEYSTTSRQGLKIHNTKIHSKINVEEFPAACDICEKILENEIKLKNTRSPSIQTIVSDFSVMNASSWPMRLKHSMYILVESIKIENRMVFVTRTLNS